jgi:hypothetical protein
LAVALFKGEGVELGVAAGGFSEAILRNSGCTRLWSIDRWDDHHDTKEYVAAARRLADAGQGRCIPLRISFHDALPLFADGSLDFIYIDGYAHTGQEGGKTLQEWWSKLRPGGVFAGHNYHLRWVPTIRAVDAFVASHQLPLHVTGSESAGSRSWWTRKPVDYVAPNMPTAVRYPRPANVILVGNGPSILTAKRGLQIDAFDEVVRFNRFCIKGFEPHAGSKTTLWSTYGKANLGGTVTEYYPGDPDVRPDRILFRGERGYPSYAPRELYRIPLKFHHDLKRQIMERTSKKGADREVLMPSSGLLVTTWMLESIGMENVTLAGFDHFSKEASKLHHYWVPRAYGRPREHDGAVEAAMFAELRDRGRITYLK